MTIKYSWLRSGFMIGVLLSANFNVLAEEPLTAPDLISETPAFTQTLKQFEQAYNAAQPNYKIPPYKELKQLSKNNTLYFASKINDTLYSSAVIDSQTKNIKSLQITYVAPIAVINETETTDKTQPIADSETPVTNENAPEIKSNDEAAYDYMAALLTWFNPHLTEEESKKELARLLELGRNEVLYQENVDNLRYVVVDHGEKGITLAVEPIKQTVSEQ